jgi:cobalamin biosynthesis protein CobT
MPKSRIQLIKEIKQARKDAKANLLYVKGLTKMKKKDLNEIYKELSQVGNRLDKYDGNIPEQEIVNIERKEDLEQERERIKQELEDLELEEEQIEEEQVVLDELEEEQDEQEEEQDEQEQEEQEEQDEQEHDEEEESEEEYIEHTEHKQELDELESDEQEESEESEEEEKKKPTKKTKKEKALTISHFKKEVKDMTLEFEENIHNILLEFDEKQKLSDNDINEITNYYHDLKETMEHNLQVIYTEMPDNLDFTPTFYKGIERVIDKQEDKINKFISM